ncbi:MAG TPA: hypothetical protein VGR62_14610 [Candidatus Binatia bacterium]|jgi:hypothetical protein|nr:hypothetical protein [Candidatus Binatia bacterium]
MRIAVAVLAVIATISTAAADGVPRRIAGDAPAPDDRPAPGVIVLRDDARREVQAWIDPAASPAVAANGKLIVRNRSGVSADVYLAVPAEEPDWQFVETVPDGFKLIVRNVTRRAQYLIAAEATDVYDGFFDWGPRSFVMRKRFRYTLLP